MLKTFTWPEEFRNRWVYNKQTNGYHYYSGEVVSFCYSIHGTGQDAIYSTLFYFGNNKFSDTSSYYIKESNWQEPPIYNIEKGLTDYGYITSTSSSTYPNDNYSGSYWYVYQGSDSIDPTAVGYSTTSITAGSSVNATVTARTNTYGGTISYRYEYSTDGGATWVTATTGSTATSYGITVPTGAKSFMVRVKAKDNLGFTSDNYVYGKNMIVQ